MNNIELTYFDQAAVALIVVGGFLTLISAWKFSNIFYYILLIDWLLLYIVMTTSMYMKLANPHGAILAIASVPLIMIYICSVKHYLKEALFVNIDYKEIKEKLYRKYGKSLFPMAIAEMPIIALVCMMLGIMIHIIFS